MSLPPMVSETRKNRLFTESYGHGDDVVLVHGWAMHGGFWKEFAGQLANHYRVTCPDLPGHGRSPMIEPYTPQQIAGLLVQAVPRRAHWIGWSLGATLILSLFELFPERVRSITLIAGNPKFSKAPAWPHALETRVLDQFNDNLRKNFNAALHRFLKIQTLGLENSGQMYRFLKNRLHQNDTPCREALTAGVNILQTADQRQVLAKIDKPLLIVLGAKDTLVPVDVHESVQRENRSAQVCVIPDAGHMPFITHEDRCISEVSRFLLQSGAAVDV